jgi:hypothetical protein
MPEEKANEKATGRKDIRSARAEYAQRGEFPGGKLRTKSFPGHMSARLEEHEGRQRYHVEGFATVYERAYPMWDMFGEYQEIMDRNALTKSLSNSPDVAFLVNHKGVTMARTTNGTLLLKNAIDPEGYTGLHVDAWMNPDRQDVRDFVTALDDKDVDEMSFAFMLDDAQWNDDMTELRITEANINRGDVSGVNYGANPFTSIHARTSDLLNELERIPTAALSRAQEIVAKRIFRSAAKNLSERSAETYQRAADNLERIAHDAGLEDFDLSDVADWEIADETETPEEASSTEDVKREFDEIEKPEDKEPKPAHRAGGKPVSLWQLQLDNLKEH